MIGRPRIALVCRQVAGLSGAAAIVLEEARRLSERGWSVHVYGERLDPTALKAAGANARRVPGFPWGSYLKRRIFAFLADRAVARGGYDLVHGHGDCLRQDVLSLHNCVHAAYEAVHGKALPEGSGVGRLHARILAEQGFRLLMANSELMREEVVRRFAVPREKVVVIYPGHDPSRFKPQDREGFRARTRRELGLADSDLLFGLVTSGDFLKRGVGTFLGALGRARRRGASVKALVMGKEARLGSYLRRAAESGLGASVRFLPPSPGVERYYHALDVYVHPALYEEFGMSVLEAMACGLPVIAGARVGAAELMVGEAREFLLRASEEEELAEKIMQLAGDPELRGRLGALGCAAARGRTWDDHFAAVYAWYERLLPGRRDP